MKNRLVLLGLAFSLVTAILVSSCKKEPDRATFPLSAIIHYSIDGNQVAFTALTHSATSWAWDFGDGNTSDEQNPVYNYESGGYYKVLLTAMNNSGNAVTAEVDLAVSVTPYVLLTGGPTAVNGKTWKLTAAHPTQDRLANADANFSLADPDIPTLPQGAFDLYLGIGEVYQDTYTFYFDGSYSHDVKEDGGAFSGIIYQLVTTGGVNIIKPVPPSDPADIPGYVEDAFNLCIAKYTPEENATFTYVESEDFDVPSVWDQSDGIVTYTGVSTLDFSGTEFVGFMDFQRKVILQDITDNSMRLVMFMAALPDYLPLNTNALILTFEVVK